MSFKSWVKTGDIVGADFCYRELPDVLDPYDHEAFDKCKTTFYVACSNVETAQAEYHRITDMRKQIDYIRASASLPYFSRLVEIDGKKYLDGGCTDSIPVEAFSKMGYEKSVVILTRDKDYIKKPELRFFPNLFYKKKYPAFAKVLHRRHCIYNENVARIVELEKKGQIFVIRPEKPLNIGRMETDSKKVQQVYDIGYADGERYMSRLKKWMEQ